MRSFAIGDIHGCVQTLRSLIEEQIKPQPGDIIYFLGDYINKGPDAKGVLDYILSLKNSPLNIKYLRGNHEQYLLDALTFSWEEVAFRSRGGEETLRSFGASSIRDIPNQYINFIKGLPYFIETGKYLIIHAGLNFDLEDPFIDDYAMLNIRDMVAQPARIGGKVILHGHVPTQLDQIEAMVADTTSPEICLDNGCVYNHRDGLSHLVGMDLDSRQLYVEKNKDGFAIEF